MLFQFIFGRQRLRVLIVLVSLLLQISPRAATVYLTWSAVSNAVGYNVLYGQSSGVYTATVNVASATSASISGLVSGQTYYFVAQAYDASNNLSPYTPELVDALTGAPAIASAPQSQSAASGATAIFTATATGNQPLTYQWYQGSSAIAGATNPALILANVANNNAGSYSLVVANALGSATSGAAVLTVTAPITGGLPPSFILQPASQSVIGGSTATFMVLTSGATSEQWYYNGTAISGAASGVLMLPNVTAANAGSYYLVALNSGGAVTSSVVTLTVLSIPAILTQPVGETVAAGSAVTLSATISGGALSYQWYDNNQPIAGATGATLSITPVTTGNAGNYYVVASNSQGSVTSSVVPLIVTAAVQAPTFTLQPSSQSTVPGGTAIFLALVSGATSEQWYFNGAPLAGATSAILSLTGVTAASAGNYQLVAANSGGSTASSIVTLTIPSAPAIVTQPASQSVNAGGLATFTVAASGSALLSYQWYKSGSAISGATSATLALSGVTNASAGSYYAIVTNTLGSATSAAAVLTVINPAVPPAFTQQPISETVPAGVNASFSVLGTGTAPFQDQWYFNGQAIPGGNSNVLNLGNAIASEAGSYYIVVANSAGAITSSVAKLTVIVPPVISSEPISQTVGAGASVTLSVAASGAGIMSYQWYHNGAPISGAIMSTYTVSSLSAASAGSYYVVVGNIAGSVMSTTVVVNMATSFIAAAGAYNGLFYGVNGTTPAITVATAGQLGNCLVGTNGSYSAKLNIAGASYSFSGVFNPSGASTVVVSRGALSSLAVNLQLDMSGASQQLTGTVSNMTAANAWVSPLTAFVATNSGAAPNGDLMMYLPTAPGASVSAPHGYASVMISSGQALLMGLLFDGTMVSESVPIAGTGLVPVYFPLYNGAGLIEGWVNLSNGQPAGMVTWIRPAGITTANPYPGGFNLVVPVN